MKSNRSPILLTSVGIILIIIAIVLLGCFFLQGKTTISGKWNDMEFVKALDCRASDLEYAFVSNDKTVGEQVKVNISFSGDVLASLSFVYKMHYGTERDAMDSRNVNHAAMNISFAKNGLAADAFVARYNVYNNTMQLSLYATLKDVNLNTLKYFMLDEINGDSYTYDIIKKTYEASGFTCTVVNQ